MSHPTTHKIGIDKNINRAKENDIKFYAQPIVLYHLVFLLKVVN